jgi:hypothetical protein
MRTPIACQPQLISGHPKENEKMQLDLSAEDAAVLVDVLDSALGDLREEIYKAEVADYKVTLKAREAIIVNLLSRLGSGRAVS